ncbi:hypothetical protein [Streptomyces sp. NPDC048442]
MSRHVVGTSTRSWREHTLRARFLYACSLRFAPDGLFGKGPAQVLRL